MSIDIIVAHTQSVQSSQESNGQKNKDILEQNTSLQQNFFTKMKVELK